MNTFKTTTMRFEWWLKTLCSFGIYLIQWKSEWIKVDQAYVTYSTGVFKKNLLAIPLQNIQNVIVEQSFLGRIFKYGDMRIQSAGDDEVLITFKSLSHPIELKQLLISAAEKAHAVTTGS